MVRLVDDLLDISRVTSGKVVLRKEFTPLQSAVQFAVEATRPLVEASAHHLTLDMPEQAVWVHGDQARLAQITNNLLTNAVKYTPKGGHITLKVWQEGGQAVMAISDDGVGIAEESLAHVFEMFSQVNAHLEWAQGGLGIGLALVRALVDMHGGQVSAHSAGPGRGSTFVVRLPAVAERLMGHSLVGGLPADSHSTPRRILAVDDNRDAVASLADMLRLNGHTVLTAFDGRAALEAAEEFGPDIVLLDIGMPGIDGHEVGRRLRALPRFSSTRLIALTGWGTEEDKALALAAGFDSHLTKPVSLEALNLVLQDGPRP
jgi:CheY-like chemotaxis protein/anti-sigma regulatory factor (Ser/Thr protein kinase)